MDELCCSTMMFADHSRLQTLSAIAELGFDAVDIWASGHMPSLDSQGEPNLARHIDPNIDDAVDVVRELRDVNLRLHALSLFRCTLSERLRRLEYAAQVGADTVIFCPGQEQLDEFIDSIRPVVVRAESLNLRVAIENHIDRPVNSVESMEILLAKLPSPALGLCIAPPHLAADGASTVEVIQRVGPRIYSFYLWDLPKHYKRSDGIHFGTGEEQLPGGGQLDFAAFAEALHSVNYRGPLNMVCHGTRGWSLSRLKGAIAESRERMLGVADRQAEVPPSSGGRLAEPGRAGQRRINEDC